MDHGGVPAVCSASLPQGPESTLGPTCVAFGAVRCWVQQQPLSALGQWDSVSLIARLVRGWYAHLIPWPQGRASGTASGTTEETSAQVTVRGHQSLVQS